MDNCTHVLKQLLKQLNVEHTLNYLKNSILSHPDHPSLLSIADTLDKYLINHIEVKIEKDRFHELPTPCIVQANKNGIPFFYCLDKIMTNKVQYFDDKNKRKILAKDDFIKSWTGVVLMAEITEQTKEPEIEKRLSKKRVTIGLSIVLGILLIYWMGLSIFGDRLNSFYPILYTLLKIVGLTVGILLLWFEVDQYNPTLQSFCSGGKKVNCNSVLKSKYASLFNGQLSVSSLGFAYFFGTLTFLIVQDFSAISKSLISFVSLITIPIIAISILYQALIIKQWCKFCILIQWVLIAEVGLALFSGAWKSSMNFKSIPILVALTILPLLVWQLIKPLMEQQKETFVYQRGLKKIKNNPDVLKGLLLKSEKIKINPIGLGISFTNKNAKYNIIKVCNPYCGPCAKAHIPLEELVIKGAINLQMIFNARPDSNDRKAPPVRHFLAIDEKSKGKESQKALDDWYLKENKDYASYANKYPMNGELDQQDEKLEAMFNWCNNEHITHTPTIYINGYQMPREYTIEDIVDVLIK